MLAGFHGKVYAFAPKPDGDPLDVDRCEVCGIYDGQYRTRYSTVAEEVKGGRCDECAGEEG